MRIENRKKSLSTFQSVVVAGQQVAVVVVEVEAGAFAVAPHLAVFALAFAGPTAVAHQLEAVLPDIPEVVPVNVSLVHVAAYRGASTDATVATDTCHLDTAAAVEEMVANLLLVVAQEAFAGVTDRHTPPAFGHLP